ncbi:transposase IS3/IS911 family protein [mine drainage metagenome]|uniref:Transposase IS3/IS911 family protein n=2 Tax=mine drainage metagenome TaxID=410659 RepID=T1C2C2_9ZZZZ
MLLAESPGPAGAARKLDLSVQTLANWFRRAREGQPVRSGTRRVVSEPEAENARLWAEHARLRRERDGLKKATASFARESR